MIKRFFLLMQHNKDESHRFLLIVSLLEQQLVKFNDWELYRLHFDK